MSTVVKSSKTGEIGQKAGKGWHRYARRPGYGGWALRADKAAKGRRFDQAWIGHPFRERR